LLQRSTRARRKIGRPWRTPKQGGVCGDRADRARTADAHLSYGNYAKAATLYRTAMTKGGVDAKRHQHAGLGIALAMSGDKAGATAAFSAVTGPRQDLAHIGCSGCPSALTFGRSEERGAGRGVRALFRGVRPKLGTGAFLSLFLVCRAR
jgi:hypothetical protein